MAIQYVGGVTAGRNGNSNATTTQSLTSLTGGIASAPAEGDLVIVTCVVGSSGRNTDQAISGYSTLGTQLNASASDYDTSLQVSYKRMGSTPDTSITIPAQGATTDGQAWAVMVFRGVDATNPFDVSSVSATGTATGRFDAAAIQPTTSGAWIVIAGGGSAAVGADYVAPTGFATNWLTTSGADTYDAMVGMGYYTGWSSGSYNPDAVTGGTTNATNSWAAWTMALRPAAPKTGSGTPSLPLLTASGSGSVFKAGVGAATLALLTATGSGTVTTPSNDTQYGSSATPYTIQLPAGQVTGTGPLLLPGGLVAIEGGAGPTLPLLTASGEGTVSAASTRTGSGTPSLPLLTASGEGTFWSTFAGSGTPSLPLLTATGAGTHWTTFTGSGAPSLPLLTASGSGAFWSVLEGSGTPSLPLLTATGEGSAYKILEGSGTPALPLLTATGEGLSTSDRVGSGSPSLPLLTASGSGTIIDLWAGSGTPSLPLLTASGSGTVTAATAEFQAVLIPDGLVTVGNVLLPGALVQANEVAESGVGSGAATLPLLTASGSGTVEAGTGTWSGSGTPSLPLLTGSGSGTVTAPDTSILVTFDTPAGGLVVGTDLQAFRVLVRKTGTPNPTCDVWLYEDGVAVAKIADAIEVTSATGQVITATWNAASLADTSGADVECFVYGHSNGQSQVEIGAIAWDAETGGTGTPSLPLLTAAGEGSFWTVHEGEGTPTLPLITASGAGTVIPPGSWSGAGTPSLPLLTASGSGTIIDLWAGSGTPNLPALTASGSGTSWSTLSGSGAATLPALTGTGSGGSVSTLIGSGAATLPLLTSNGSGAAYPPTTRAGYGAVTLPVLAASGDGVDKKLPPNDRWLVRGKPREVKTATARVYEVTGPRILEKKL